jgi:hypothetical protein
MIYLQGQVHTSVSEGNRLAEKRSSRTLAKYPLNRSLSVMVIVPTVKLAFRSTVMHSLVIMMPRYSPIFDHCDHILLYVADCLHVCIFV